MNAFNKMFSLGMIGLGLTSATAQAWVSNAQLMDLAQDVLTSSEWLASHMPSQNSLADQAGALRSRVWIAQMDGRVTETELNQLRAMVRNIRVAALPLRRLELNDLQSLALSSVLNSTRSFMNRTRSAIRETPVVEEEEAPSVVVIEDEEVVVIIEESPEALVVEAPVVEETPAAVVETPAVEEAPAVQEAQ